MEKNFTYYNEKCHFQSDCPDPKREKINLAEKEEGDPALFPMETCELTLSRCSTRRAIFLNVEKVVPNLTTDRQTPWYLDT
jgi:hypothetical protein